MKITVREIRQIIMEESQRLEIERVNQDDEILREAWLDLRDKGFTDAEVIDGLLASTGVMIESNFLNEEDSAGGFFSNLATGAGDVLKNKISQLVIDTILSAFQVNPQTPFGQMARAMAINVGENFEYSRWREYFSEDSCPLWSETIGQAIGETVVLEPIMSAILVQLGLRAPGGAATPTRGPDIAGPDAGLGGVLAGTLIRSLEEALNEALMGPITDAISNRLCRIRVRDIVGDAFGLGTLARRLTGDDRPEGYYAAVSAAT
jgi:hypothetical protein